MNRAKPLDELVMSQAQREDFLGRVRAQVSPEDYRRIETLCQLVAALGQDNLGKLRHWLFGRQTETTDRVCPPVEPAPAPVPKPLPKGHGRHGAAHYTGARWIEVSHPLLQRGQRCPQCDKGSLRAQPRRGVVLRISGSPPISATGWSLEKLRCDTCGEVFTAPTPPQAGTSKYDESVGVTVAVLRYGSGMPHYRLARLQQSLGVPLPECQRHSIPICRRPIHRTVPRRCAANSTRCRTRSRRSKPRSRRCKTRPHGCRRRRAPWRPGRRWGRLRTHWMTRPRRRTWPRSSGRSTN